ncbi:hypothetical protein ARMGADRAFT_1028180 [Armillaria gallica]|uniref:Uncharacterized protein n=1 Tax=Armillaria gallica TaxID=47427 RepID=A0A2H3DWV9_ARMGA|nr:hypothetical protein ARMGADRAFT_1028180 [Armillaria gallica]
MPPIKMLMPIPEDDKMPKYKYFVQFNPVVYYQPYRAVMDLILPYWRNKDEYTGEEVADLLRQIYNHLSPCIATLEHEALIDSHVGMAIHNWVMHIHDALPRQFHISDWHCTITHMASEVLIRLSPNMPFPGEDGFNMDDPLTPLESYLLQHTVPEGALLWPGLITNNDDFPGHVFDRFPTLLPDAAEDKEVIVFKSPPKKEPLSTPTHSQATSSTTPALPVPPRSTHSQKTPISLVPPVANLPGVSPSPHHFLRVHTLGTVLSSPVSPPSPLASRQAPPLWSLFSPVKPLGLYCRPTGTTPVTPSHSAGATAPATNNITTPPKKAAPLDPPSSGPTGHPLDIFDIPRSSSHSTCWRPNPLLQRHPVPPLPPVSGQGGFAEEEWPSTIVEELPPPGDSIDVDVVPSPPRVYHLVTGTPLHSCSLVVCSPSPKASPSNHGDEIQQREKQKKKKAKGKGKAVVLSPEPSPPVTAASANIATSLSHEEPPSPPKKVLKRKCAPSKTVPSEPGPSKLTCARVATPTTAVIPSDAEASDAIRPSIKKPCFSPKKASKKKSSCKTTKSAISDTLPDSNRMFLGCPKQQYLAAELTQAQDPGQEVTVPNKFFDPVHYSHKNGTYGAHSLRYAYYAHAPDHYEKTCLPCVHRQANCTWNNWFPGANCDQCQEGCHGSCSARYTAHEMHEITSRLTTFARYNIPALCRNILQLHSINCKLEHINYLYHGHLHAHDCVVCNIAKSLDKFTSAEGGNKLIEDLSHVYCEVCSFIVDDGL